MIEVLGVGIVIGVPHARAVGRIGGAARAAAAENVEDKALATTFLKNLKLAHLCRQILVTPLVKLRETRCS
jgi:hypothetical protein